MTRHRGNDRRLLGLVRAKCVVCGKVFQADDRVEIVHHQGKSLRAHRPCIAQSVEESRFAREIPDERDKTEETPTKKRARLFRKMRVGLKAVKSAAAELEEMGE